MSMVREKVTDQVDRISGKAKQLAGRASGNIRWRGKGWIQSVFAGAKITVREIAKTISGTARSLKRRRR